ncbi:MAG TPA: ABC transporter substrate-binding protein [Candidatus Binatia bacterium]|jgi:NitT/TauT family transport system substrate-binding protein
MALRIAACAAAALLFFAAAAASAADEGLKRLRIAYPSNSLCCVPLFAAVKWKIFEENGLSVEIVQIRSQLGNAALAGGEIQSFAGVGPASVSATLRGLPSRAIWFASDRLIYSLLARPGIRDIKDLRNKKIGLTGLGGTSHVALQIALEAAGENPKNFIYLSLAAAQVLPAVESGVIDAAILSPPFISYAQKKGLKEIFDVGARVRMPLGGLTTTVSALQNRPDEVKRVIRSLQLARRAILQSKEKSVALIASFLSVDRQAAEETYVDLARTSSGSGVPTRDGIAQIIQSLQMAGQFAERKVAFEDVADDRIAKEVARELGYKVE